MHRICKNAGFRPALVAVAVLLLASCGGGGGGEDETADAQQERKATSADFEPPGPIPADAHQRGMWSSVYDWPLIPIHAVLLPDERVLSYGSTGNGLQSGSFIYDVWDPQLAAWRAAT